MAYKILYYLFCEMDTEILRTLKHLSTEEKRSEPVSHALQVRQALAQGNYGRFFKLYRTAPNLGSSMMEIFVDKHRILCLSRLAMAYVATNVDVAYLTQMLAFSSQREATEFLERLGCKLEGGKLLCKDALPVLKKAPLKLK